MTEDNITAREFYTKLQETEHEILKAVANLDCKLDSHNTLISRMDERLNNSVTRIDKHEGQIDKLILTDKWVGFSNATLAVIAAVLGIKI